MTPTGNVTFVRSSIKPSQVKCHDTGSPGPAEEHRKNRDRCSANVEDAATSSGRQTSHSSGRALVVTNAGTMDAAARLAQLAAQAATCTDCRLCGERTQAVFADGSPSADLMFIGEGPGRNEDLQSLPFVGRARQLLNELLEHVGLRRQDIYIANVVKCRPPGNRDPRPDEIDACKHFLADQIRIVDPKSSHDDGELLKQTLA